MEKNNKIISDKWYTVSELVRLAEDGIFPCHSKIHIKRLFQSGKLRGVDIGARSRKQWRILGKEIINFIDGNGNN